MSVFKRLWSGQDKDNSTNAQSVEEMKEYQPFNPFTELLFLEKHTDIVRLLVVIDSKRCVSAADDNLAIIWDVQFGYKLVTLSGHTRPITAMLYLPNRMRHLVTGSSDKQIRLWNIDTGDCIRVIIEHKSSVKCLMLFGTDGHFCSGGEEMCLWSPDGQLLASYGHEEENSINFMILLTGGRVVAAMDKQLVVYSVETSTKDGIWEISFYRKLPPHREAVRSLIIVSDKTFASGSIDGTISVWNVQSLLQSQFFNSVAQYEGPDKTFPHSVEHMRCLNQRYLVVAIGAGFAIYDTENGQTLHKRENAHHSKINCITFTCAGLYLVTAAVDGTIRLWSYVEVLKDCISGDSNFFGTSLTPQSGIHEMWWRKDKNPHSLALVGECQAHSGSVQVVLDCDGESLVSCGIDGLVIVWKNENIQMMKRSHILQTLTSCDGII